MLALRALVVVVTVFSQSSAVLGYNYHYSQAPVSTSLLYPTNNLVYQQPYCASPIYTTYQQYYRRGTVVSFPCGYLYCTATCVGPYWYVGNSQCLYHLNLRRCGARYSYPTSGVGYYPRYTRGPTYYFSRPRSNLRPILLGLGNGGMPPVEPPKPPPPKPYPWKPKH